MSIILKSFEKNFRNGFIRETVHEWTSLTRKIDMKWFVVISARSETKVMERLLYNYGFDCYYFYFCYMFQIQNCVKDIYWCFEGFFSFFSRRNYSKVSLGPVIHRNYILFLLKDYYCDFQIFFSIIRKNYGKKLCKNGRMY